MIDNYYLKSQSPAADRPVLFHPNTYPEQPALFQLVRHCRQRLKLPGSEGSGDGWLIMRWSRARCGALCYDRCSLRKSDEATESSRRHPRMPLPLRCSSTSFDTPPGPHIEVSVLIGRLPSGALATMLISQGQAFARSLLFHTGICIITSKPCTSNNASFGGPRHISARNLLSPLSRLPCFIRSSPTSRSLPTSPPTTVSEVLEAGAKRRHRGGRRACDL